MKMKPWVAVVIVMGAFGTCALVQAEEPALPEQTPQRVEKFSQVIVQIGGRFCEYHRDDVEQALRRHAAVEDVEFLNDHGTVLVRYRTTDVHTVQFVESVERALVMGWGCKAWVDRGSPPPRS